MNVGAFYISLAGRGGYVPTLRSLAEFSAASL